MGKPYKLVWRKLWSTSADPFLSNVANLELVIDTLFPSSARVTFRPGIGAAGTAEADQRRPFSAEELVMVAKRLALNKAPGLDCVPNAVIRHVASVEETET